MSLPAVFSPRSIAVIGASSQTGTVGNDIVRNLTLTFRGEVYPVNLKGGELYDRKVYTSISEVKGEVDLAVIAVPAAVVPSVLEESGKKGVRAVVVISAGFKERGGEKAEQTLAKIAKKYNMTLVGPNCLGVMNPHVHMNASFAPTMPPSGSISFISQSGALGSAILDYANGHGLGFAKFISMGNKAAVDEQQMLEYLSSDPQTKVILLYIEQLSDLAPILKTTLTMRRSKQPKPIIVLKSGQTSQGMAAAQSHTGALAGSDAFYDALFRQAGIIRAESIEELFLYAECFTENPLFNKDKVAVVTNAGGLGVLVTDALVKEELKLAELSNETTTALQAFLPEAASVKNPIDILGDAPADRYKQTLEIVLKDHNVAAVAVLLTPQSMTNVEETARTIALVKRNTHKPVIVSFLGGKRVDAGEQILQDNKIVDVEYPEDVAKGLRALFSFGSWKNNPTKAVIYKDFNHAVLRRILNKKSKSPRWLSVHEVFSVLEACRIPTVPRIKISLESQAEKAVRAVGKKAVLKILSPDILHKNEVGGVALNVTPETAKKAYASLVSTVKSHLPKAKIQGVLVMQQVEKKKQEVLIGAVRDPNLGALVACGMGGVYTEAFNDSAFGLVPLNTITIKDMLGRLKIHSILQGSHDGHPFDRHALVEVIQRVSYLVEKYPSISEMDINPIFVFPNSGGVVVADARLRCI